MVVLVTMTYSMFFQWACQEQVKVKTDKSYSSAKNNYFS